uniref:CCHC-type domain-containing protein n=2 Tax=Lactuca sativa TaxID=4236 RepID=A0A9R1VDF8_LACSA|nr:hypothetical protein LSAT_V11C500250510 [Lactuca sativa]
MINASYGGTIMMQDSEDAWRFLEQLSHGSKNNYSAKKRDNLVSSIVLVGLDKNWKSEVKYDINSLNKKFDLLLSSLGKEKGVFFSQGRKICVSCGDSGHIADECMRIQEQINEVHAYGQFQNNPRSFNRNYNQGANYNNNGNFNNNNRQGNYQNQNQPKQFQ